MAHNEPRVREDRGQATDQRLGPAGPCSSAACVAASRSTPTNGSPLDHRWIYSPSVTVIGAPAMTTPENESIRSGWTLKAPRSTYVLSRSYQDGQLRWMPGLGMAEPEG
jgi:hypothetical protein